MPPIVIEGRMRGALVLRPEPGNARTAALLNAAGADVLRQPLFAVTPVDWLPPDPAGYDALLLTSANAVRHAGDMLSRLTLPVVAVGEATATAARAAGLTVALTGGRDAAAVATTADEHGFARLLHPAGRDRVQLAGVDSVTVYSSDALPIAPGAARGWTGHVALLHSVRAARQFVALVERDGVVRRAIAIAALSPAVLAAAGIGWADAVVAARPTDAALVAGALPLIDHAGRGVDKRGR